jgi:predicted lipid-binding transport protein (Tim44 family)
MFAVYVRVDSEGLPWWQVIPLTLLGVAIAFGLIKGFLWLLDTPKRRRFRKRVEAVAAAAGDHPYFAPQAVLAAAHSLYMAMHEAWNADDRYRMARITSEGLMTDWEAEMSRYAAQGRRYRAELLKGPQLDYVGIGGREGEDADWVVLRVRAKVKEWLEAPDGDRKPLAQGKSMTAHHENYWDLSRRNGEWVIYSIRSKEFGEANWLTEEIVGPAGRAPAPA